MARILLTIPTYNEERVITRSLEAVSAAVAASFPEHDVIIEVADNGSTDRTAELVRDFPSVALFSIPDKGKGLAIRRSWERHLNDCDVLMFTDVDLAADLGALPELVGPILRSEADIVCGSRFVSGAKVKRRTSRELASRLYRFLQHVLLHLPVEDAQCGLKAISAKAAARLLPLCNEDGWLFDSELLAFAAREHLRVCEIPVTWVEHRDVGRRSALRLERDGWKIVLILAKIRKRVFGSI